MVSNGMIMVGYWKYCGIMRMASSGNNHGNHGHIKWCREFVANIGKEKRTRRKYVDYPEKTIRYHHNIKKIGGFPK